MKGPFFNKIFLLAFFLLISIKKTTQSENIELNMIADASLNATASFASFEHQNYLYFLYDMNPFFKDNNFRTSAVFKLTSKERFYRNDINYSFLSKKIDEIKSTDIIGNGAYIYWRYLYENVIAQKTLDNEYDHYININRTQLKQNNFNTLVLRIKVSFKKGDLTIENLFSLPKDIKNSLYNKTNNNIFNQNLRDSLNKDNYNNNNYHKNNYNNINHNYQNDYYNNNNNYKDYYNNNNYNNYNYGKNKYYGKTHYHYHTYHRKHFHLHNIGLSYAGIIFAQIWSIIFILYCIVNRRKVNNNRFAVIVGNVQQ
jgi:hypothetical protein